MDRNMSLTKDVLSLRCSLSLNWQQNVKGCNWCQATSKNAKIVYFWQDYISLGFFYLSLLYLFLPKCLAIIVIGNKTQHNFVVWFCVFIQDGYISINNIFDKFCVKEVETFHHNHNTLKCNEEENDISLNDVIVMKRQQK